MEERNETLKKIKKSEESGTAISSAVDWNPKSLEEFYSPPTPLHGFLHRFLRRLAPYKNSPYELYPRYRHELKIALSPSEACAIRQTIQSVAQTDSYAKENGGFYHIRSLYFDSPDDTALREKIDGVSYRVKYRLRYYNGDPYRMIRLERKLKNGDLSLKNSVSIGYKQAEQILLGEFDWEIQKDQTDFLREFLLRTRLFRLCPKTIVEYAREPYVYSPGNVRITFDSELRTGRYAGRNSTDFLNPDSLTIPIRNAPVIMEVKWDHFLPASIQAAIHPVMPSADQFRKRVGGTSNPNRILAVPDGFWRVGRQPAAFSKYARSRVYD